MPIVILAHGLLGAFDEIIFISIAIVFVGMMGVSWFRSQQLEDEDFDPMAQPDVPEDNQADTNHFELR